MVQHHCHAKGCTVPVPPKMFMCRRHWYTLPKSMRDAIWAAYRPGQEVDKNPTVGYMEIAEACIDFVALKETKPMKPSTGESACR